MKTPAWYKGISPNFVANKYMWVNDWIKESNGSITLYYSERIDKQNRYTDFHRNRETTITGFESVRLCNAEEINEIGKLSGAPIINNHYSII